MNLLELHISERTYLQGAELLFQQAQSSASGALLLDSAHLYLLGGQTETALDISLYLNNSALEIATTPRALRILYLSLIALGKHREAFQLCQELIRNNLDSSILEKVLAVAEGSYDIRRALATVEEFWPLIEAVSISGKNNRVCVDCTFKCRECERSSRYEIVSSMFRLLLSPCQYCLHPYALSAIQLEPILHQRYPLIDMDHYIGAELLAWNWVKNWWQSEPQAYASEIAKSVNILDAGMYDLRQLVAEAYYRTIAENDGHAGKY